MRWKQSIVGEAAGADTSLEESSQIRKRRSIRWSPPAPLFEQCPKEVDFVSKMNKCVRIHIFFVCVHV